MNTLPQVSNPPFPPITEMNFGHKIPPLGTSTIHVMRKCCSHNHCRWNNGINVLNLQANSLFREYKFLLSAYGIISVFTVWPQYRRQSECISVRGAWDRLRPQSLLQWFFSWGSGPRMALRMDTNGSSYNKSSFCNELRSQGPTMGWKSLLSSETAFQMQKFQELITTSQKGVQGCPGVSKGFPRVLS